MVKMKEDLKNKVIAEIEEKGIKPKSKSSIRNKKLAELLVIIFMASISFIVGAVALNTLSYFVNYKQNGFFDFLVLTSPLVLILMALTILITICYKSVGDGYKHPGLKILIVVASAIILGSVVATQAGIHHARFVDDPAYRLRKIPGPDSADPQKTIIGIKKDEIAGIIELKLRDESTVRLNKKSRCFPIRCDRLVAGDIIVEIRPVLATKSNEAVNELFVRPSKNVTGSPRGPGRK